MAGDTGSEDGFVLDAETLKAAEKIFRRECRFVAGADSVSRIPLSHVPEVAFAGRSNVGKSSLINAITGRKSLARASNTPGRTQQINFFDLDGQLQLADLPGYGYAKATRSKVHAWNTMVSHYLKTRANLKRLFVLIDARHGVLAADYKAFDIIDGAAVPYIAVLTKADKVKKSELEAVKASVEEVMSKRKTSFPRVYVTSAEKGFGIPELRAILLQA
ncbi:MAG TPA: ribosome biogenesis GTP-binding protein YihA/YsxC [Alphaproteobacteria bacterium]|nr:YihA family ribosome biogenesis GTP-binding protein [Alphaproteobacteria bacterium]HRI77422.1 ribosome biogenesis GTP-binding protein YihA/YsxC [Alphaproteobacteria bacterium]HRJ67122.1 ribosome biogenesis GTP-binding protein YihA/YsxC [Alphaproteobacteria bacterium]